MVKSLVPALLIASLFSSLSYAVTPDRISGALTSDQTVTLRGNVHHKALPQYDQGPADPSLRMGTVMLLTMPTASQQKALKELVAQQQDRKSPNYHKWLTPEQWADRFGLSQNDANQIAGWLKAQGFSGMSTARGRNWISFTGTAAQVQNAFGTEIHRYSVGGEMHFANATAPNIPAALSGIVVGFRGLDDFRPKPMMAKKALRGDYYYSAFQRPNFVAPGDIQTIYDLSPLYNAGIDGTGQKMVIVGQTDVYLADLVDFRSGFSLPSISGCTTNSSGVITACNTSNFVYVLDGTDPGVIGDVTEADLDLEWSAAIAPGAQIIFVNSTNVFTSYYYAIDNQSTLGETVISMSYGECEFDDNLLPSDEIELTKANSLGITFMNSSGDNGSAECDPPPPPAVDPNNLATGGLAVSYPASSPEVTGVGGTAITYPGGFSSTYWGTTNPANGGTAQNPPLPETAWNDNEELTLIISGSTALSVQETYGILQGGGGASNCSVQTSNNSNCVSGFPQPSWQTVTIPGVTSPTRFSPDVSLLASPDFPGYIFCTPLIAWISSTSTASSCAPGGTAGITNALALTDPGNNNSNAPTIVGGTSASAPVFAAIVTLLNQYLASSGLGNINPTLYTLAKTSSNGAFHQVTTGDNNVYCVAGDPVSPWPATLQCPTAGIFGYSASNKDATTGYNLVTGLGSVDANNLALAWLASESSFSMSATAVSPASVSAGNSVTSTVTITPQNSFSGTVSFSCSGLPTGATCSFNPTTVAASGTTQLTIQTSPSIAAASNVSVTVNGTSGAVSSSTTVSLTVTATTETFSLTSNLTGGTLSVTQGQSGTVNLTVASTTGFIVTSGSSSTTAAPVSYACSGLPSESTCSFSPSSTSSQTSVTMTISTTAATAALRPDRGMRIFCAALLPGLLGIMFTMGSRKRSLRGMRMLGLIMVLGFSTLWLGSCSGSNGGSNSNPGTPKGTTTITVNATTGGSAPIAGSPVLSFSLTVN